MFHFFTRVFLVGLFTGILLSFFLSSSKTPVAPEIKTTNRVFNSFKYRNWFKKHKLSYNKQVDIDQIRYGNKSYLLESQFLFKNIPVLCIILVKNQKNVRPIEETWGQSCNSIKFVNISIKKTIPSLKRKREDSSWTILCKTLIKQVPDNYKWIIVVYDYTFVVVENLRYFMSVLDPDKKYYLGHAVQFWGTDYNTGQAGYVLSRGTINLLKNQLNSEICSESPTYMNREDYYLGKYLAKYGIHPKDTRDDNYFSTFLPHNLFQLFNPNENNYKLSVYPEKCCSPRAITFQSIEGDKMYTYYYLLYTLQLFFSGRNGNKQAPKAVTDDEVWQKFLRDRNIPIENISAEEYYKAWEELIDDPTSFAQHLKREEYVDYSNN